ncbi:hypothetical protein SAMN02745947_05138 [Rhodococcus rhodochrous J3]|uniref:Uncharacterized protein n=1 Tax=Rhodococcus rhodochrous J3 TaxID=903528 RepID=A0ABY1MI71_RHORH|nr:hypothetical protein [Rhodococcus rhodochrous]SMG57837.1 hypothetical protein SAMN02745947_05138 [Rhodococcus rhodochrous J3]
MSGSGDAVHNETKVISARSQARSKLSERRAELLKRISDNQRDLERALASLEKVDKAAVRRDAAIAKANEEFEKKKAAAELAAGRSLAQVAGRGETATSISELVDLDVAMVRRLVKLAEENNDSTPPAQRSSEGGSEAKEPTPDVPVAASGS